MVWKPDPAEVKAAETLGRRVYGESVFERDNRLRVDHFYDNRIENDLSVDRLGNGQPITKIKSLLSRKAAEDNSSKPFKGWAGLKVKSLVVPAKTAVPVLATPLHDNIYHADISRSEYRSPQSAYSLAFRLREVSESDYPELIVDGEVVRSDNNQNAGLDISENELEGSMPPPLSWWRRIIAMLITRG